MSPASSSCASEETCSTEDYFNKDIHQSIVNTMKQLQRGAKSISVTFSTIDKYVKHNYLLDRGKSLLKLWGTTLLTLIFVWLTLKSHEH